ncbi:MAG: hypothetical protein WC979_01610 [Candidatus Pacearchaeota archaeon]|jgi:hypothetical protein|nr:hypothetical protein [Clostridia bacterium]
MKNRIPTLNEYVNEMFVSPRTYKTYIESEWTYDILKKVFYDYFGINIADKDEKIIFRSDIASIIMHYGATHHQSGVLNIIAKILIANGHEIENK